MNKALLWPIFIFLFLPKLLFCVAEVLPEPIKGPWFTGPLLTPAAFTVPQGHVALEPFLYINNSIGNYNDKWKAHSVETFTTISTQVLFTVGLTSFMDIQTFPQVIYNHTSNQSATRFADVPVQINLQLCREHPDSWIPDVKFALLESFPTGKFDNLNPKKKGTDASGDGSYITVLGLLFAKSKHFGGSHYFRSRFAFGYSIPSPVDVKGFNIYGGTAETKGKIYPGNEFTSSIGLEYSPVLHWALAMDILTIVGRKTKFSGQNGSIQPGVINSETSVLPFETISTGRKSFEQISLAPAIEYNFGPRVGLVAGVWFSILGRNCSQFVNGVMAVNMFF